jgi:hypothetical protein
MQKVVRVAVAALGVAAVGAAATAWSVARRRSENQDAEDLWADVIRRAQPSLRRAYDFQQSAFSHVQ